MTAPSSIDPTRFLPSSWIRRRRICCGRCGHVRRHADVRRGGRDLRRPLRRSPARSGPTCATATGTAIRHPGRHLDVAIPKLREGSYFPDWLLERRRRAERALTTVVATCYLLGVSTRRMEKLVESLGIKRLSRSQVSVMARSSTRRWRRSAPARWTRARIRSWPPTPWC